MGVVQKQIKGFEKYYISSTGVVFSTSKNKELKSSKCPKGYERIWLYNMNGRSTKKVHRLVAEAFIPNPLNKEQVNHIDGNKSNNSVENLEWSTPKENVNHARRDLKHKNSEGSKNPLSKGIYAIKDGEIKKSFGSINEAKREGFNIGNISRCLKNKSSTHCWFYWRYDLEVTGIYEGDSND